MLSLSSLVSLSLSLSPSLSETENAHTDQVVISQKGKESDCTLLISKKFGRFHFQTMNELTIVHGSIYIPIHYVPRDNSIN